MIARFEGAPIERSPTPGVVESTRDIAFEIPETLASGQHHFPATIRWEGGKAWAYDVAWRVTPTLKAAPSTLVVRPSRIADPHDVIVRSSGRPFRIVGISGARFANEVSLPTEPSRSRTIRIVADARRIGEEIAPDVVIATDDPTQPTIRLKVVVPPSGG